jgi:hypothetical protein
VVFVDLGMASAHSSGAREARQMLHRNSFNTLWVEERAFFISQVASYSAGRDIAVELISEPSTGTNSNITATDQIRPIATTIAIPIHESR